MSWTVYVCPNCGKRKGGAYFCRCVMPSARCRAVEVFDVDEISSKLAGEEAVEAARVRLKGLGWVEAWDQADIRADLAVALKAAALAAFPPDQTTKEDEDADES